MIDPISKLAETIVSLNTFSCAKLSDEYYYNSVAFCVIDAVYSINAKYPSTRNTVIRFADKFHLIRIRDRSIPVDEIMDEYTLTDFLHQVSEYSFQELAEKIFQNRQRTSTRSGILKAEAVVRYAKTLNGFGIERMRDVSRFFDSYALYSKIRNIPGHNSGISLSYFYMLCGDDDRIKADRRIRNFIFEVLGEMPSVEKATGLLEAVVSKLSIDYPTMTMRLVDSIIWRYMVNRK